MRRRITLTLGIELTEFTKELEEDFKDLVSRLSGASFDQIDLISVRSGCVKITIELDEEALSKMLRAIEPAATDLEPLTPDQKAALNRLWGRYALQFFELHGEKVNNSSDTLNSTASNRVFFVHGWRGSEESFGTMPDYVEKLTGCACSKFVYPTGFFQKSASISFLAMNFDNWVRNELSGNSANFAIVAHSMGGIVVRDFLSSQLLRSSPLSDRVKHVSFVASPQGGTWLSKIAKLLPNSATQQVADLSPGSEYLGRVNSSWNAWLPKQHHLKGRVRSFFATEDEVVDYVSAIGSDPEAIPILDATHSSIIKPNTESDEIVRTIVRFLEEVDLSNS